MSKTALVTGASGFVGSCLADELLNSGYKVKCLVRESSSLQWIDTARVDLVRADLDDRSALAQCLENVDFVFHSAGVVRARHEAEYFRVNGEGTRALAEAAVAGRASRVVLISSLAAAGPSQPGTPHTEEAAPRPFSIYGRSKLKGEQLASDILGERLTIVRPPAVYGPRDRDFPRLFRMVKRGIFPEVTGQEQQVSLVHVSDLVRGLREAAESSMAAGETYFLSDPLTATWQQIASAAAEAMGVSYRRVPVPRGLLTPISAAIGLFSSLAGRANAFPRDRVLDLTAPSWTCSPAKAQAQFNYQTRRSWPDGIRETVRWCMERHWL